MRFDKTVVSRTLINFATYDFPLPGGPLKMITIFGGLFCRPGGHNKSSTIVQLEVLTNSKLMTGLLDCSYLISSLLKHKFH